MNEEVTVTREAAIDALALSIFFIQKGKLDAAIGQLSYLIDVLQVEMATEEMAIFREALGDNFVMQ